MATLLDASLIAYLTPAIIFIFVWTVTYAILSKVKILGDNRGLNGLAAFSLALIILLQAEVSEVLSMFIPWVFLLAILIMFLFLVFMFMGLKEDYMIKLVKNEGVIYVTVISAVVILFFIALSNVFGPFLAVTDQPGFWESVKRVLFHPRVLGAVFILVVAAYLVHAFERGFPMPGKK